MQLSVTICWYVYACRVRLRCDVTWLPLWGSVALRLSHKIRLQLTEGSRVQQLLLYHIDPGGGT